MIDEMMDVLVVMTTFGDEEAAKQVARALLAEELVACVNLQPGATSLYRWKGELCEETEVIAFLKTTVANYERVEARLAELHPYEEPEIVALPVAAGSEGYLGFVRDGVR